MKTKKKNQFELVSKDDPRRTLKLASLCARIAYENRAEEIEVLDISNLCSYADFFIIATGHNLTHLQAIAEYTECEMEANDIFKLGLEGRREGGWVLLDYGNFIVQLFDKDAREFYQFEELWAEAPQIDWKEISGTPKEEQTTEVDSL